MNPTPSRSIGLGISVSPSGNGQRPHRQATRKAGERGPCWKVGSRRCLMLAPCCGLDLPCLFLDPRAPDPDTLVIATGTHPQLAVRLIEPIRATLKPSVHVVGFAPGVTSALPRDVCESAAAANLARRLGSVLGQRLDWDVLHGDRFTDALVRYSADHPRYLLVVSHDAFGCTRRCNALALVRRAQGHVLVA